jgi:small-conductance mechanosensitive channel
MELTKKIKLTLDETWILILGAQILLGFQFRMVFSDRYEELPAPLQWLDGVALVPMICVVALLITPGPYRIVQNGEDSRSFHRFVTTIASLALVPFAIALSLDVVVTFGHLFGEVSGVVAGIAAGAVAIGFWYGYPLAKRR